MVVIGLVAFLLILAAVVLAIPGSGGTVGQRKPLSINPALSPSARPAGSGAVELELNVDWIDPGRGEMSMRLVAAAGSSLPADGATVFTSLAAVPYLVVRRGLLNPESSAVLSFTSGDLADYPFDAYRADMRVLAVEGTSTSLAGIDRRRALRIVMSATADVADVDVSAALRKIQGRTLDIAFSARRTAAVRAWVLAMMAIYWALAILVIGVAYVVLRGRRSWETRLLAMLISMLFALVVFRATAPGVPGVGTFFDYFAVIEGVTIVALVLALLMVYYVVEPQGRIES